MDDLIKKPIRLLLLSTWNTACGIASYSSNLVEQLEKLGIKVEIFSDTTNFNNLVKLAKDTTADIVHIQHEYGISIMSEALLSLIGKFRIRGKPVTITTHTEVDVFNVLLDGVANAIILHNDKKNLVNKNTFSRFVKIPHGIPEISFKESKAFYRKKYDIPENAFVIGTCGFLTSDRGQAIENLIVPLSEFVGQNKDIYLNIATSTHRSDNDSQFANMIKSSLLSLAAKYGFNDRIYVNTKFMDTQEFRERLYTFDIGFSYASNLMVSNSGAAADIVSCKVPLIVNDVAHFSHLAPYCCVVQDDVNEMAKAIINIYNDKNKVMPDLQKDAARAVEEMGYSVVAKKHKEVYETLLSNVVNVSNKPKTVIKSFEKKLDKDNFVSITCPNELWQILLLWKKLYSLIKDGYRIQMILQNDGMVDSSILKYVLKGFADVQFADIGLQHDSRLTRLHSRSLAQNMMTDVNAWLSEGNSFKELFSFLKEVDEFPIDLGDYAKKRADNIIPDNSVVVNIDEVLSVKFKRILADLAKRGKVFDNLILMGSPLNRLAVEQAFVETNGGSSSVTKVIEDTRTRWAICLKAKEVITGWNDVAAFCLLNKVYTIYNVDSEWQKKLITEIGMNCRVILDELKKEKSHVN